MGGTKVVIRAHAEKADEIVKKLKSDSSNGLSAEKVVKSKETYGENKLTQAKRKNIFVRIIEGLLEPMMLILLVALVLTLVVNFINLGRGQKFDLVEPLGIIFAIFVSTTISLVMEGRSAKAFDALNKIGDNVLVKVIRDGKVKQINQSELVVGDIIKFEVGDKIPVDCRLIKTLSFSADESPLTGESNAVKKDAGAVYADNTPLAERKNMVYGGCFVTNGSADAIVIAVGDFTEIGKIAKELSNAESTMTPLQQKLDRLGKMVAVIGGIAAGLVFIVQLVRLIMGGGLSFDSVQDIFLTSIVLIVASVPEGLPTIVAVSLALNVIKMAKHKALVKKMVACETVGSISIICSDKTGTLTENKMTVSHIYTSKGIVEPRHLTDETMLENFAINSTANIDFNDNTNQYNFIGSPTECAMLVAYNQTTAQKKYNVLRQEAKILHVYPFSSDFKRMTTVVKKGNENRVYVKGAPEIILEMCSVDSAKKQHYISTIANYQKEAKRVIGIAHGSVASIDFENNRSKVESNLVFDGFVIISDPIRKEVYSSVKQCFDAGIQVKMLTGDNIVTATAIARELKMITSETEVFHADQIEKMSDEQLKKVVANVKVVARSTPMTKLRIVKILKELNYVVAVTGDGINDAPAIKNADVGIAMGIAGTEVSKEASDIVLIDDSFSTIVTSVHWGRGIYENFQRFILFQLTVNLSAVLVTIVCILSGMEAPFNSLQLLWLNLIMDGPPGLTLGLEPIYDELMRRKPIKRDAPIITRKMRFRIAINGIFVSALIVCQALFEFIKTEPVVGDKAKTILFTLFVVCHLFNAFNSRELGEKSVFTTLARNKIMLIVMTLTFVVQVVITQYGGFIFNTTPLDFNTWVKIILTGFSIIAFNELYKLWLHLFRKFKKAKTKKQTLQFKKKVYSNT